MRTKLLTVMLLVACYMNAQTTHNLNWFTGIGSDVDLEIEVGDKVIWTWTDALPHTVTSMAGATESFNSGTLTGVDQTFEFTFMEEGVNDYLCGIHGANSMSGTITVMESLSVNEKLLSTFSITPNPVTTRFMIKFPKSLKNANVEVFDILGKRIYEKNLSEHVENHDINTSSWKKGVYLVKVSSASASSTQRLIKQ